MAEFKPQELTVKQARNLLLAEAERNSRTQADPAQYDRYSEGILEDINLHEMAVICGVEVDAFDDLRESELAAIADKCKKANPLFFKMRERERKRLEELMTKQPGLLQQLMQRTQN